MSDKLKHKPDQAQIVASAWTSKPEKAIRLREAAEGIDGIDVRVLDPTVPKDADTFASVYAKKERQDYRTIPYPDPGTIQYHRLHNPRTPEEIEKDVVARARRNGEVLVVVEQSDQVSLQVLWQRAGEIAAQHSVDGPLERAASLPSAINPNIPDNQ